MMTAAFLRWDGGQTGPAALVYITIVSACGLLIGAGVQVLSWRLGSSIVTGVVMVFMAASLVLIIVHTASLRSTPGWPALMRTEGIEWLAGAPWVSIPVLGCVALLAFYALARAGMRVKATSEACL